MGNLSHLSEHLRKRAEMGREKYGTYLSPDNGRNALVDAYQDALDLIVYLRQKTEDRDTAARPSDEYQTMPEPAPVSQSPLRIIDMVAFDLEDYFYSNRYQTVSELYWTAIGLAESMRQLLEVERLNNGNPL